MRLLTRKFTELLFADDAVATGTDRDGMERAAKEVERLVKCLGLTLRLAKTKFVVVGGEGSEDELRPLVLEGGSGGVQVSGVSGRQKRWHDEGSRRDDC